MAAHLKKRALADYAQTVTEEGQRSCKQQQLVCRSNSSGSSSSSKPRSTEHTDWVPACLTDHSPPTVMAALLTLHHALPLPEEVERETVEYLMALVTSFSSDGEETSEVTRQDVLVQLLAALAAVATSRDVQIANGPVVESLCKCGNQWLQKEQQRQLQLTQQLSATQVDSDAALSSRVLAGVVRTACSLSLSTSVTSATPAAANICNSPRQQVLKLALTCLSVHQHHLVKVSCLEAAGAICPTLTQNDSSQSTSRPGKVERQIPSSITTEVILALLRHSTHHDNRVRTASFKAMVCCERGRVIFPPEAYDRVCDAVDDDYQCVREAAIDLIKNIALNDPERRLTQADAGEEPERLADHAFFRICGCMNDVSVRVRVSAALALSCIPSVSPHVLLQTLDKKLFSNMRRKLSYHERQAALVSSGQWSRGREWGEDSVKEQVSAESTSLTHSAGAFVHGLEDECLEVRNASLDALAILAEGSSMFATQCLDFLVDMFNDEIEDVRLKAVQVLQRIVRHIRLQEDQLDEILHALKDSWQCIRESVHTLIGSCTFTTTTCLQATVAALMDNIRRYPQDVPSIQQCMVSIGCRQSGLVAGLVPRLLLTHPYFDAVQPSLHQPHYICKLLLVLNAAAKMPTILPLLEEHTMKHYAYLRDTLPNFVPLLNVTKVNNVLTEELPSNTEFFLQQSLCKLRRLERASTQLRLTLYSSVYLDLQKLSALDPTMSAAAEFAALYTRCSLLLTRLLNCSGWLQQESSGSNVQQLVSLTFRLVHAFTGLGRGDRACARGMRLRALALQLVYVVNGSTGSALGLCEAFLSHVKPFKESNDGLLSSGNSSKSTDSSETDIASDEFLISALNQLKDERRPGTVARTLQPLLSAHPPTPLPPIINPRAIRQASAKITEPNQDSDAVHKLTAGLLLAMPLDAQLYHIPDPQCVRIRIAYPDQSIQHVVPRLSHLQPTDQPHCYRLVTTVLLTAGIWSEACKVQISLVLDLSPAGPKRKHDPHTIDLSHEPTTLMLWPKPMKKGIL